MLASTLLLAGHAWGQEARYSQSAGYREMVKEMHTAAPSPAYLATGRRPQADPRLAVTVAETATELRLSTTGAELVWTKATGALGWRSTTGGQARAGAAWQVSRTAEGAGCATGGHAGTSTRQGNVWTLEAGCAGERMVVEFLTADVARVQYEGGGATPLGLRVEGGGPYFGLGERFWKAGLSATTLDVRPQDRYGEPGHNWTYVAVPLVYTPGGVGLYVDTAFDTQFDVDGTDTAFGLKVAKQPVPIYLFAEASPKAVLRAYTGITGRPAPTPAWVFGPWVTALQGKGPVLDTASRLRSEGIPASALWIYDEQDEANNLGWPFWFNSYYGDPRKLNDQLHSQGFRVLTYVHPYLREIQLPFTTKNPVFAKAAAEHLMQVDAAGKPAGPNFENVPTGNIDFSNPKAIDLWQDMITNAVSVQGFDGWMEDFGEWVRDGDRLAGGDASTMSELYPLLYHKATLEIARGLNPQIAPFVRSGSAGSQGYSVVLWGADQWPNYSRDYGLPSVVTAGITAGMSGYSTWGPDILSSGSDKELWMRWVEFGALTPVMRDHVWMKPERSWNLWSDAETTAQWRRYAVLHSSLAAYFLTLAAEAERTGVPIMRHPVLEYPNDPRAAAAEYEYLLGEDLLVAPVVSGGTAQRTFYLPEGEWVSFWGGDHLRGGQEVTMDSGVGTIPIVVRAGSILPFKPAEATMGMVWERDAILDGPLLWHAYPAQQGAVDRTFTLPNGTSARFVQDGTAGRIEGKSKTPHAYEIVMRTALEPTETRLNGAVIGAVEHNVAVAKGTRYWWNPSTAELHVVFTASDFRLEVAGIKTSLY